MNVQRVYTSLLALSLAFSLTAAPARGKDAPAEQPRAAAGCKATSVDLTNPALVALLQKMNDVRPASTIRVEENGEGAERTRVATQDFESTTPDTATPVKTTVTCTSGTCLGLNCAVVGCDPITVNGQTGCSPCNCVPVPPAITCSTNSCTCTKVTTQTPGTPAAPGSETTEP